MQFENESNRNNQNQREEWEIPLEEGCTDDSTSRIVRNLSNLQSKRPEREKVINNEDILNLRILIGRYESRGITLTEMLKEL